MSFNENHKMFGKDSKLTLNQVISDGGKVVEGGNLAGILEGG